MNHPTSALRRRRSNTELSQQTWLSGMDSNHRPPALAFAAAGALTTELPEKTGGADRTCTLFDLWLSPALYPELHPVGITS